MDEHLVDDALLRGWPLPDPGVESDKEARGRVIVVAGCPELPGAAVLCAEAALRAGAGKVLLAIDASISVATGIAVPEARLLVLPDAAHDESAQQAAQRIGEFAEHAAALLIGPGLLDESRTSRLAGVMLARHPRLPAVLDAAALHAATVDPTSRPPVLMTPHAGELAHLVGLPRQAVEAHAPTQARDAASRWNAVVVLKGATTYIASPDGRLWRHDGGAVGLATAGSGDVLGGLIAGFVARGCALEHAAVWGVALHARAGARLAHRVGRLGYLAREIATEVPGLSDELASGARIAPARAWPP
jgi:ADP-dependent NAD(P)H-hydrate dehydratase